MKRLIDIVLASMAIVILSPIILLIAVLVAWRLGPPVFFRQRRAGFQGAPFCLIKFRTMDECPGESVEVEPDEKRLTRFGQALRASSLDELPELWNVLRGDMSIVGPRPLLMEYVPLYTVEQFRRHDARPGITGWAQVNGRNRLSWEDKFALDVWYVDNRSLWLDTKIMFMTMHKMFRTADVNAVGESTMPRFTGTKESRN